MSLFDEDPRPTPARHSRGKLAVDTKTVTTCIGVCPASEWLLISATVLDNCMCMCRKSRATGGISYVILKSCRSVDVPSGGRDTITIPSFIGAKQVWSSVTTAEGCGFTGHNVRTMDCKPAFALIRSDKLLPPSGSRSGIITSDLYLCLFGVGQRLSNSPALLIGSQNGNIYVTNFMSCREGVGVNQRDTGELLCPLYSLEQPVVGIHTAFFPPRRREWLADDPFMLQELDKDKDKDDSGTHNAIIFLGQGGKIAVCYAGNDGRSFPSFVEFHVPGPVLSSILIPRQCLLYSTLQGLHRVCLRQDCAASIEDKIPSTSNTRPIKIPEISFKFPEMLRHSYCGTYFLAQTNDRGHGGPHTGTEGDKIQCVGVSLDGRLSTFQLASCADSRETTRAKNSSEVSREIKCSLQSVQKHNEKIEIVMEKIQTLNVILAELKGVLNILCAVGRADTALLPPGNFAGNAPFSCSFSTTSERVGASLESLSVQVELTYSGTEPDHMLTNGWSLLVTCQNGNFSTSKAVSLAGLPSGDSVTLRVDQREGPTAALGGGGSVSCFVHYNPRHLHESVTREDVSSTKISTTSKGVCLFLARKEFDILDFLTPAHKHTNKRELLSSHQMKTVRAILSPEEPVTPPRPPALAGPATAPVPLLHTSTLPIALHTAISTVQACSGGNLVGMDTQEVVYRLLCALLPTAAEKLKRTAPRGGSGGGGGGGGAEILMSFDRENIRFKLSSSEASEESGAELRLEVHATSRTCLVRVLSGVKWRLRKGEPPSVAESREKLCGRLEELRTLQGEVAVAQQEISTAHRDSVTNCLSVEDYHKAIRTCESRVFTTYCKLREIP